MPQAKPSIAHGPDNPQTETSEQQEQKLQLPDGYEAKIVETITTYRTGWAPDRLLRIPGWMRNVLMFRGSQLIEYDPSSNTYVDVIAYNRANGKAQAEDTYLEKYSNNITQMLEGGFSAVIAGEVPSVIVKPENAEILADVTTAKASQEAISIIERMNGSDRMLLSESNMLYLWGVYFKHTRAVLDGDWAGWDYEDTFGPITVQKPDRYHCFNCGTDTPAQQFPQGQAKTCPKCGAAFDPEAFLKTRRARVAAVPAEAVPVPVVGEAGCDELTEPGLTERGDQDHHGAALADGLVGGVAQCGGVPVGQVDRGAHAGSLPRTWRRPGTKTVTGPEGAAGASYQV